MRKQQSKLRNILQNNSSIFFKNVKVVKNKARTRCCYKLEDYGESKTLLQTGGNEGEITKFNVRS